MQNYKVRASNPQGTTWYNTNGNPLDLEDLKGKVVILDFWTSACINCLHVAEELKELEEKYADELVIIGVHSPKFEHEKTDQAVAGAIERSGINHPVVNDSEMQTWQEYGVRAWPTLAVIDSEGYYVGSISGEGHGKALDDVVGTLVEQAKENGTLDTDKKLSFPEKISQHQLSFPGKIIDLGQELSDQGYGRFLLSDTGNHSIVALEDDLTTIVKRYGSGQRGFSDGSATTAKFNEPQGLVLLPQELRKSLGYDVIIADVVNHRLRSLNLDTEEVETIAGTGVQRLLDSQATRDSTNFDRRAATGNALKTSLSSPWDIAWSSADQAVIIAMAGTHQMFAYDPVQKAIWTYAGSGMEGLQDGSAQDSWFAQPSGVIADDNGILWLADSETSSLRNMTSSQGDVVVKTAVGTGLFDFGYKDGVASQALFQHPLGVGTLPGKTIGVADTYNGAIRQFDPKTNEVTTVAQGLKEPSDLLMDPTSDSSRLIIVDSGNHQLKKVALSEETVEGVGDTSTLDSRRPAMILNSYEVNIDVSFTVPKGQKLDDRFGDSTELKISSTPESLIIQGAGIESSLQTKLILNPSVEEGIIHITAKAASCDGTEDQTKIPDSAVCHLYKQDWSIPAQFEASGPQDLNLELSDV